MCKISGTSTFGQKLGESFAMLKNRSLMKAEDPASYATYKSLTNDGIKGNARAFAKAYVPLAKRPATGTQAPVVAPAPAPAWGMTDPALTGNRPVNPGRGRSLFDTVV